MVICSLPKLCEYVQKNYFSWVNEGHYPFSTCHVENLAAGLIAAAEKGINRKIYFIKDREEVTLREFLSKLLATQGLKAPKKNVSAKLVTAICYSHGISVESIAFKITAAHSFKRNHSYDEASIHYSLKQSRKRITFCTSRKYGKWIKEDE